MKSVSIFLLATTLTMGCDVSPSTEINDNTMHDESVSAEQLIVDSRTLSDSDLEHLSEKGRQGDAEAALRVATHYDTFPDHQEIAIQWYEKSAELGNSEAAQNLVVIYMSKGESHCNRAAFWLRWLDEKIENIEERERLLIDNMKIDIRNYCPNTHS